MIADTLPGGTITFLFTDIEGSTTLWERHGEAMRRALATHDQLLRAAVQDNGGRVVKTTGDGIHAVFASAADGLRAALQAQRELKSTPWDTIAPDRIRVRMGLHTGEAELRDGDYYGSHVNRAARLMSIGHGDQILLSGLTADLLDDKLTTFVSLRNLGEHTLRGLDRPEHVFQVVASDLPADFPPLRSTTVLIGNLPARVTSFVGRAREMAQVRERLQHTRLLTLVGPGGTGKTRLSLQVAADVQADYAHGTWWVELAPVTDPAMMPAAVFAALGLSAAPGAQIDTMLLDYLREKELLLVLDNCEHLIDTTAHFAAQLIDACPHVTILASSREGLGVYGESTIHLPTLNLPGEMTQTAETAQLSEAVLLFVERATAVRPGFRLTDDNAATVAQIVRRLDGIPLAIELAAARMTVFPVEQIAARLDDRFRLLTGGSRTALPRQQTLRALIDWSYDLLDEDERALFRRLSVFTGGWTFEAAEFMADDLDVYALLPQLINKSLVVVSESPVDVWGTTDDTSEPRYRYLETIRQYARDRLLDADEADQSRERHFDYYCQLSDLMDMGSGRGAELMTSGHLLLEHDNLQTAVEWGLEHHPDRVLEMCWNMAIFLADQNPGGDGPRWVKAALDRLDTFAATTGADHTRILHARLKGQVTYGLLLMFLGEVRDAQEAVESVLEPLRILGGDPIWRAIALFVWANSGYFLEDPRTLDVVSQARIALENAPEHPSRKPMLALALYVEAITRARDGGGLPEDLPSKVTALLADANDYYLPWVEFVQMSLYRTMQTDPDVVLARLQPSLARLRKNRSYRIASMLESDYAHILREAGRLEEAAEIYRRTIRQWQDLGHRAAVANQLECMAFINRAWEQPERAVQLLGAAERLREDAGQEMLGAERALYVTEVAALQLTLTKNAYAALWAQGRELSTDAAVSLAVSTHRSSISEAGG